MLLKYLLTTLNICGLFCLFATPIVASAASTVMVKDAGKDDAGKVVSPQNFVEANKLVTNEVICVRVDMFRGGMDDYSNRKAFHWSDAELKVLDKNGNLLYFATTSYDDVIVWHCPEDKEEGKTKHKDNTWDSKCKIYYYIAGTKYAQDGQCSSPKQPHEVSKSQQKSIGGKESIKSKVDANGKIGNAYNFPITAVEFYPDLTGSINEISIREIFLNPENTIIVSRKNSSELERTANGDRVWRPTIPQYYRK